MVDLNRIKTIVVVMLENRSLDHLLGHLSLDLGRWANVDGLKSDPAWLDKVSNAHNGQRFAPFHLRDPYHVIDADPPHERGPIALQMGVPANGTFPMDGFVTNYAGAKGAKSLTTQNPPPVMGYFTAEEAPVTDFFVRNFAICDHWFSSLPAGTQPNRLMAMSGVSRIDVNQVPLPEQELAYDWLTRNGIRWRVYHEGMPFFAMMPKWIGDIVTEEHFRPLERLSLDVDDEPPGKFPQVIFIEPTYTDAPHIGFGTDDHAPSAIRDGQKFLLEVYRDMTKTRTSGPAP
jgi:phospholipase C